MSPDLFDVVVVGGGPAGLTAALVLGRARQRVLLLDAGEPRNARAHEVHGFLTRDGTPPAELRRIGQEQLAPYASVERRTVRVEAIAGGPDAFRIGLADGGTVRARRVLLTVGMIDEVPDVPGYRALWGHAIFQCPFCHGWEVRDRAFGVLVTQPERLEFGRFVQAWSRDVVVFTEGRFPVPDDVRARLTDAGVAIEERPIRTFLADDTGQGLAAVELADGTRVARDVLFAHPHQRQTALVADLGLALDDNGFVRVDARMQTSRPGISAAGDLTTQLQVALGAAAAGQLAAAMLVQDLVFAAPAPPAEDAAFWDAHHARHHHHHGPNRSLADDVAGLAPAAALDLGCGDGADARWLADHGWRVTAVDHSDVALARGRSTDPEGRVDWRRADLGLWTPPSEAFDLVKLHHVHVPPADRPALFRRLATALRPGGVLLVVAHHPSDRDTTVGRPDRPELYFTADELLSALPEGWEVLAAGTRDVPAQDREGKPIVVRDMVLKVRRPVG